MCIAFYTKPNVIIDETKLLNSSETNSDGFGIAWIEDARLKIFTTMKYEIFLAAYGSITKRVPESPKLVHFRKATKGEISESNCHPFRINKNSCFVHNGTITNITSRDKKSDTQVFNEDILQVLPEDWQDNGAIVELVESFIGTNRMIFLNADGKVLILNEDKGHWADDKGWWASNYSYYKGITSLQLTKPTFHQLNNYCKGESSYCRGNSINLEDIPGKNDDWKCSFCQKALFSWQEKCPCGAWKESGEIDYSTKTSRFDPRTDMLCPHCRTRNYKCRKFCIKCEKDMHSNVIQLPFTANNSNKTHCTYCGRKEAIKLETTFANNKIELCQKCVDVLKKQSSDLYFPLAIFRENHWQEV